MNHNRKLVCAHAGCPGLGRVPLTIHHDDGQRYLQCPGCQAKTLKDTAYAEAHNAEQFITRGMQGERLVELPPGHPIPKFLFE